MIHDLLLLPLHPDGFPPLSFRWDEDVGTVTGRDADRVRESVHYAKESGSVAINPPPNSHKLTADPLRSRADMAAIFCQRFILPSVLREACPVGDSGDNHHIDGVTY